MVNSFDERIRALEGENDRDLYPKINRFRNPIKKRKCRSKSTGLRDKISDTKKD